MERTTPRRIKLQPGEFFDRGNVRIGNLEQHEVLLEVDLHAARRRRLQVQLLKLRSLLKRRPTVLKQFVGVCDEFIAAGREGFASRIALEEVRQRIREREPDAMLDNQLATLVGRLACVVRPDLKHVLTFAGPCRVTPETLKNLIAFTSYRPKRKQPTAAV